MSITAADSRGTIIEGRNFWSINNALVEEVFTNNRTTGHLIVSYAVRERNNMTRIDQLQLNVDRNTIIRDQWGNPIFLSDIRPGMWIDTQFSPFMTRSIPPQTTAFRITVRHTMPQPVPPANSTTDRIVRVDTRNNFLITGSPYNINRQTRYVVTDETVIINRNGHRISLRDLRPGLWVGITHAAFQTASIPPQTTAYRIRVL